MRRRHLGYDVIKLIASYINVHVYDVIQFDVTELSCLRDFKRETRSWLLCTHSNHPNFFFVKERGKKVVK